MKRGGVCRDSVLQSLPLAHAPAILAVPPPTNLTPSSSKENEDTTALSKIISLRQTRLRTLVDAVRQTGWDGFKEYSIEEQQKHEGHSSTPSEEQHSEEPQPAGTASGTPSVSHQTITSLSEMALAVHSQIVNVEGNKITHTTFQCDCCTAFQQQLSTVWTLFFLIRPHLTLMTHISILHASLLGCVSNVCYSPSCASVIYTLFYC